MKRAKIIISLQVIFLAATIVFSTGIAYNNVTQATVSISSEPNLLLRLKQANEVADVTAYQNLAGLADLNIAVQETGNRIAAGQQLDSDLALKIPDMQDAYMVRFIDPRDTGQKQMFILISREELPPVAGWEFNGKIAFDTFYAYAPNEDTIRQIREKSASAGQVITLGNLEIVYRADRQEIERLMALNPGLSKQIDSLAGIAPSALEAAITSIISEHTNEASAITNVSAVDIVAGYALVHAEAANLMGAVIDDVMFLIHKNSRHTPVEIYPVTTVSVVSRTASAGVMDAFNAGLIDAQIKFSDAHRTRERLRIAQDDANRALLEADKSGIADNIEIAQADVEKARKAVIEAENALTVAEGQLHRAQDDFTAAEAQLIAPERTALAGTGVIAIAALTSHLTVWTQENIPDSVASNPAMKAIEEAGNYSGLLALLREMGYTVFDVPDQGGLEVAITSIEGTPIMIANVSDGRIEYGIIESIEPTERFFKDMVSESPVTAQTLELLSAITGKAEMEIRESLLRAMASDDVIVDFTPSIEHIRASSAGQLRYTYLLSNDEAPMLMFGYSPTIGADIQVDKKQQAIAIYSDALQDNDTGEALKQALIKDATEGTRTRRYYLVNRSDMSNEELLKNMEIPQRVFDHIYKVEDPFIAVDLIKLALEKAGISQVRVFALNEEDLNAWSSKRGALEVIVMMLKDKRFEIITNYTQQHEYFIRAHVQALIAA